LVLALVSTPAQKNKNKKKKKKTSPHHLPNISGHWLRINALGKYAFTKEL
jgi:hypothetical protein